MEFPKYSIVIPAYNESARIPATLESVVAAIRANAWDAEVIVVNDGSTDSTAPAGAGFCRERSGGPAAGKPRKSRQRLQCAGRSFERAGRHRHVHRRRSFGADGRGGRLFKAIADGADIAIGSRWLESGRQTHRQPLYRQFFGRCFNAVCRMVMQLPFADTQCGFKAFTRSAAQTVFQLQTIERWGFDPEILFIALKRGFRVVEVPVSWAHDERTRMSYLRDGLQMLKELAIVRWNALTGQYNKQTEAILRTGETR